MKKILTLISAILVSTAVAEEVPPPPEFAPAVPIHPDCFLDSENTIDLYASFVTSSGFGGDRFSTGIEWTKYFYTIPKTNVQVGVGGDAAIREGSEFSTASYAVFRVPIEKYKIAPYVYTGAGWVDSELFNANAAEFHNGVGVDIRIWSMPSIFLDWRYTVRRNAEDTHAARIGVRYNW